MANTGNDIANDLGDTFSKLVNSPAKAVTGAVDAAKNFFNGSPIGKAANPQDTSWHDDMVRKANQTAKDNAAQPAPKQPVKSAGPKSYKEGTDFVPKTGKAKLHKGEAVLKKEDADQYRAAKGATMAHSGMSSVADE